jgi:ethylene receptor
VEQVAVALSRAVVLEEWQTLRDMLAEQHGALLYAKHEAAMVTEVIYSGQRDMCGAMERKMHSFAALPGCQKAPGRCYVTHD